MGDLIHVNNIVYFPYISEDNKTAYICWGVIDRELSSDTISIELYEVNSCSKIIYGNTKLDMNLWNTLPYDQGNYSIQVSQEQYEIVMQNLTGNITNKQELATNINKHRLVPRVENWNEAYSVIQETSYTVGDMTWNKLEKVPRLYSSKINYINIDKTSCGATYEHIYDSLVKTKLKVRPNSYFTNEAFLLDESKLVVQHFANSSEIWGQLINKVGADVSRFLQVRANLDGTLEYRILATKNNTPWIMLK